MTDVIWGPWIKHDGKGCPVPAGTPVRAICESAPALADKHGQFTVQDGVAGSDTGEAWDWKTWGRIRMVDGCRLHCGRIVGYRYRTYPAATDLLARLAGVVREDA